jgi:hypothetical protein
MKLNRSSGKRAGEIECSLSQEDLSTASATRIWIRFCAINGFRVVGRPAMPTVCEHFRLLKEEPGVLDTPGSCVPRDSAPGAFSPGRSYRVLLVD